MILNNFSEGLSKELRRLRALALRIHARRNARLVGRTPETQTLNVVNLFGVDSANRVDKAQGLRWGSGSRNEFL